jgi:hypothetical protein
MMGRGSSHDVVDIENEPWPVAAEPPVPGRFVFEEGSSARSGDKPRTITKSTLSFLRVELPGENLAQSLVLMRAFNDAMRATLVVNIVKENKKNERSKIGYVEVEGDVLALTRSVRQRPGQPCGVHNRFHTKIAAGNVYNLGVEGNLMHCWVIKVRTETLHVFAPIV